MKAKTYTDYYNILLEGCKEAFKSIELKEYLYTDEAMEENKEYFVSKESIKQIGINKSNNLIVNYQIERDMKTDFLRFLERQQQVFEKKYLIPRNEFYEKCLKSLNIKLTELNRQEYRVLNNISDMGTPPDPLLFLEYMKWDIKSKSLQTNKTPEPQQDKNIKTDEKYKTENLFNVGLLFAKGELNKYFTINNKNEIVTNSGYSAPRIAKELKNDSYNKWILASLNNYKGTNGNKNIFNSLDMMTKIISHCEAENIPVDAYFKSRLPIE